MLICGIYSALNSFAPPGHSQGWLRQTFGRLEHVFSSSDKPPQILKSDMGIWKVIRLDVSSRSWPLLKQVSDTMSAGPLFYRLVSDIFTLYPGLSTLYITSKLWSGIQRTALLYTSAYLLRTVISLYLFSLLRL